MNAPVQHLQTFLYNWSIEAEAERAGRVKTHHNSKFPFFLIGSHYVILAGLETHFVDQTVLNSETHLPVLHEHCNQRHALVGNSCFGVMTIQNTILAALVFEALWTEQGLWLQLDLAPSTR